MAWESRFDIEKYEGKEEKWIKKSCRRSYKEAPFWKGFWKVYGKQNRKKRECQQNISWQFILGYRKRQPV